MGVFYEWIRNITYYLIFMTVVANLLPNKKYEKYFRLFAGMVLILLVLKPFTGGLRLDDKLAYYFESISFKKEASELTSRLSGMEEVRLKSMVNQYEEAVEHDVKTMAEASGFVCKTAEAEIDGDDKSETFGRVAAVRLILSTEELKHIDGSSSVRPVEPVEKIRVELEGGIGEASESAAEASSKNRQEENSALAGLRRRICEYYDLEEQDIEIQLEKGEG